MSQRYLKVRYLQFRIILVASVLCLIAQGVIWFSHLMKVIADSWVKWPFGAATILFIFAIYDFIPAVFETKLAIGEGRYLSQAEQQAGDKVFYSGVMGFAVGCVALVIVICKLIAHTT